VQLSTVRLGNSSGGKIGQGMRVGVRNQERKAVYEPRFALLKNLSGSLTAADAQGKEACFMDSVRRDSTVPYAELKPGGEGLLARIAAQPCADAKPRGATSCATIYQEADECMTLDSAPVRSRSFRSVETFAKNRPVLWAREEPIAVAIVDGDAETRFLLHHILEQSGGYRCVGSYASGDEALREIPVANPRIVLMDVRMPGITGIECLRRLKGRLPGLIVVLVSELTDPETMSAALAAGGDGYLTKPFAVAQCLATVRFSFRRDRSAPPDRGEVDGPSTRGNEFARLTDREHQVMSCLAKGLLYKEIADKQCVSISVVRKLAHNIYTKLRVSNRTEAIGQWQDQRQSGQKTSTPLF
jgi:DNA-binding NarL/FixJ family response regulator